MINRKIFSKMGPRALNYFASFVQLMHYKRTTVVTNVSM